MAELTRSYSIVPPLWGEGSPSPTADPEMVKRELRRPFSFISGQAGCKFQAGLVEVTYDDELTTLPKLDAAIKQLFEVRGHRAEPNDNSDLLPEGYVPTALASYRFSLPIVAPEHFSRIITITNDLRSTIVAEHAAVVGCVVYERGMDVTYMSGVDRKEIDKYVRKIVRKVVKDQPALFPNHSIAKPAHVEPRQSAAEARE